MSLIVMLSIHLAFRQFRVIRMRILVAILDLVDGSWESSSLLYLILHEPYRLLFLLFLLAWRELFLLPLLVAMVRVSTQVRVIHKFMLPILSHIVLSAVMRAFLLFWLADDSPKTQSFPARTLHTFHSDGIACDWGERALLLQPPWYRQTSR